jgi:hypothetical protein
MKQTTPVLLGHMRRYMNGMREMNGGTLKWRPKNIMSETTRMTATILIMKRT